MYTINRESYKIKYEIDKLYDELKSIQEMDDEAVCEKYNVDKIEEVLKYLTEDLERLLDEYEERVTFETKEECTINKEIWLSFGDLNRQLSKNY